MGTRGLMAMVLLIGSACARLSRRAPPPDPHAELALVRFEAPRYEGRVRVATVGTERRTVACIAPCDLPMRVGRTAVVVRGEVRIAQTIEVPRGGARYEIVDPAPGRRQAGFVGIGVGGGAAAVGVIGLIIEAGRVFAEGIGCAVTAGLGGGGCGSDDAARTRIIAFTVTAAVGALTAGVSALAGFTGPSAHLRRLPNVDVGVAPLPGGAAVTAGASF